MKSIIEIIKNYKFIKKNFFFLIFFSVLFEIVTLFYPKITQYLIQVIESKWSVEELFFWIYILIWFTFIFLITKVLFWYFDSRTWLHYFKEKSQYYQRKILDKNYKDVIDLWTGKLIARLDWVNSEADIFTSIVNILVGVILKWILIIIILFFHIPQLVFVVLVWIILLAICNFYLRKYITKHTKIEVEAWEEYGRNKTRISMENFTIKLFWKKKIELKKVEKSLSTGTKSGLKVDFAHHMYFNSIEVTIRFLEVWVFIILWTLILQEWNYSIAYLVMIIWYIWLLWNPIEKAIMSLNRINRVWEKYKKLRDFIEKPNDIIDGNKNYKYSDWKIELNNIDFSYWEWKNIFRKFSLGFLDWKKNALIWHSGGGKSSIIKILLRLYDYQNWEVLIDGQDLKNIKIDSFYKHIGYLPQEPSIFDGTIRENLEYALPNKKYKDEILWKALKDAQIESMIRWLKDGLGTEVWEKWIKLSGWEKQRLAIARIFLKNPEIIILDEPTSALDSLSEDKLTKALKKLMKWKTSIIIAHRLQTVMDADKIIVIEKWKIESEWKHKDLLIKSPLYKKLVDLQNGKIIE